MDGISYTYAKNDRSKTSPAEFRTQNPKIPKCCEIEAMVVARNIWVNTKALSFFHRMITNSSVVYEKRD